MSEFHVASFRLGKIGRHPKADRLEITNVMGYPVITALGTFKPGDLAVHIPPDSIVDTTRPDFAWLADKAKPDGTHRVKFCKIRGVPSFGFLMPAPEGSIEGQNLQEHFGITKYIPPAEFSHEGKNGVEGPGNGLAPHYDIEGMRKYAHVIEVGELVQVTEKIHGMNGRWIFTPDSEGNPKLFCGSRTQFREDSIWNRMAEKYKLSEVLSHYPGVAVYGEIYGKGIQDLDYGVDEPCVTFFDAYDSVAGEWLSPDALTRFCVSNDLPKPPILFEGGYDPVAMEALAEGKTVLGNGKHVREGVVIKPMVERYDNEIGRVFLKRPGIGYLERKSQPE